MSEKAKEKILDLLKNDTDIRNEIIEICKTVDTNVTSNTIADRLKIDLARLEREKNELEEKNGYLLTEIKRNDQIAKEKIGKLEENIQQKLVQIEEIKNKSRECCEQNRYLTERQKYFSYKYATLESIYSKYLELGVDVISGLERVLNPSDKPCESIELFIAYGSQENNIVALWEAIATNVDYYSRLNKIQDLTVIFEYFLTLYKRVTFKNVCIVCPDINDQYDERIHTRTSSSSVTGRIEKVLLPGFTIGKNISKKALVIVR